MLTIEIPGREALRLSHLILDYNGTIALDGALIDGVAERIALLREKLAVKVVTADTHGTAVRRCAPMGVEVLTYPTAQVGKIKADIARSLRGGVACIGNGYNDIQMAGESDLSICVMGHEGCCAALLTHADVVVTSILDALDLLCRSDRLRATLRT